MVDREPASVLLPTTEWGPACEEVAAGLADGDELLVLCDTAADPVAGHETPDGVDVVVAGEPQGCSGKANALACGMERASNDRFVWTDDDFARPESWLEQLVADYERVGPASELPVFVGADPLSRLLEPLYAYGTFGLYRADVPWGGALVFDRSDVDAEQVRADLRRTVSDDGLLSERLEVTQQRRVRRVEIGGSLRASLERHVRFVQTFRRFGPRGLAGATAWFGLLGLLCVLAPLPGAALVAATTAGVYAALGIRRPSVFWSPLSVLAFVPLLVYALARRTFVWSGRRYRWRGKFDTTVVGAVDDPPETRPTEA